MTKPSKSTIRKDARGQFARNPSGRKNDGVASAKPRVITKSDDATTHKWPPGAERRPKDWTMNYDIRDKPSMN